MRALTYGFAVALLTACPKSDNSTTTTTADASSSATPAASASQVVLAPLDTSTPTASATGASTVAPLGGATSVHSGGVAIKPASDGAAPIAMGTGGAATTATPAVQTQFKQCCAALHKQSQQQSPQAAQLAQAAGVCDTLVASMASAPVVPQLDQVKMLLAGVPLPPVCQGL